MSAKLRSYPGLPLLMWLGLLLLMLGGLVIGGVYLWSRLSPLADAPMWPASPEAATWREALALRVSLFIAGGCFAIIGTLVSLLAIAARIASRGRYTVDARANTVMRLVLPIVLCVLAACICLIPLSVLAENHLAQRKREAVVKAASELESQNKAMAQAANERALQERIAKIVTNIDDLEHAADVQTHQKLFQSIASECNVPAWSIMKQIPPESKAKLLQILSRQRREILATSQGYIDLSKIYQAIDQEQYQALQEDWKNNIADYINIEEASVLASNAAEKNDLRTVGRLLDRGFNPRTRVGSCDFFTLALEAKSPDLVKLLLKRGVAADTPPSDPWYRNSTALAFLCDQYAPSRLDFVRLLLEAGADPNRKNSKDQFPLHVAIQHDHADLVKLLLEYKAEPNVLDADHCTALELAESRNGPSGKAIAEMLLKHGAKHSNELPASSSTDH
jgi:hypothetical protein